MFHEDGNEYSPLKIAVPGLDVPGYYNIFNDNSKTMNFKLDDDLLKKVIDIFHHIGEKLNIDICLICMKTIIVTHILKQKYLMIPVLEKTRILFDNTIPNERIKYNCRVLLQNQSVYYNNNNKGIIGDEDYYPEVFLQQCRIMN